MRFVSIIIGILVYGTVAAQGVFIARVDSTTMLIGDQNILTVTLHSGLGGDAADFHLESLDTCTFLDIITQSPWIKTEENNQVRQEKKIKFALFDPGTVIIPSLYAIIGTDTLHTYTIPIEVIGVEPDSTGLLPIKGIVRERAHWSDYLGWIISGLIILLGYVVYRYIQHRKKIGIIQEIHVPETVLQPHEIALIKLRELQKSKMWEKGEVKEYHVQLTYILREYLEHRYQMPALESTSMEILKDVKNLHLTEAQVKTIDDILHIADWVKFAKGIPEDQANSQAIERVILLVHDTQPLVSAVNPSSTEPEKAT